MLLLRYHPAVASTVFPLALFAVAALQAGCHVDCAQPYYRDLDGDGYGDRNELVEACDRPETYVPDASDCNDAASAIHPGAPEACNGVDDDCDGVIDPDGKVWFGDLDHDGYGTAELTLTACSEPDAYVERPGDCDDLDPAVHPGAEIELCDGIDQDCDGLIDEGADGTELWYPDADFDGWGWEEGGRTLCAPPAGWIRRGGDCDDTTGGRAPDANELCNGFDDDCDGLVDDADAPVSGLWAAYVDADGDGYGAAEAVAQYFCFVPFGFSTVATDCDDGASAVHPGGSEVCGPSDEDCDGFVDELDPSLDPTTTLTGWNDADGDGYGDSSVVIVACTLGDGTSANDFDCDDDDDDVGPDQWIDDLDGDGAGFGQPEAGVSCSPPHADMVNVSAPVDCDDGDGSVHTGAADPCGDGIDQDCSGIDPLCGSVLSGFVSLQEASRTFASSTGADAFDRVGAGGDVTGDGFLDAVLAQDGGDVVLFSGPPPETIRAWPEAVRIPAFADGFGAAVTIVRDVSNDGLAELVVSAPREYDEGAVYLLTAPTFDDPLLTITGVFGYEAGASIANAGDIDGDTYPDLVVGAPGGSRVALVELEAEGVRSITASRLVLTSVGRFGASVDCCADLTGDGVGEIVAGAPEGLGGAGVVNVVRTNLIGTLPVSDYDTSELNGSATAALGSAVTAGGDIDGDGKRDLGATAPGDDAGGIDAGAAFAHTTFGSGEIGTLATLAVYGEYAGASLAAKMSLGDLDHDGADDLLVGSPTADVNGPDSGAIYVWYGPRSGTFDASDADAVIHGDAGAGIGASFVLSPLDPDLGNDLWIADPSLAGGGAWLIPGP